MRFKVFMGTVGALLLIGLAKVSQAAIAAPTDIQGHTIPTADFVGGFPCVLDPSSAVQGIQCSSATAAFGGRTIDTSGRGEVIGVIFSSAPTNNSTFLVLRDTGTANVTSSTMTIVTPLSAGNTAVTAGQTVMYKFPIPLQYQTGLNATMGAALTGTANVTIIYRPFKHVD